MVKEKFPSIVDALEYLIKGGRDKGFIRIESIQIFSLSELISRLGNEYRIGILDPFDKDSKIKDNERITHDPAKITSWRNDSEEGQIIVFGDARNRLEAGLREAPLIIKKKQILEKFEVIGVAFLSEFFGREGRTDSPIKFFKALSNMTQKNQIDSIIFSTWCNKVFSDFKKAHETPQKGLWELGLLPDKNAQGSNPQVRIKQNNDIMEMIISSIDTSDEVRIKRIEDAAKDNNPHASKLIYYRDSPLGSESNKILKGVELEDVLLLLRPKKSKSKSKPKRIDFITFINQNSKEDIQKLLKQIKWNLGGGNYTAAIPVDDVTIVFNYNKSDKPIFELFERSEGSGDHPTKNYLTYANEAPFTDEWIITQINNLIIDDDKQSELKTLVKIYLEKRRKLGFVEHWFNHLKELLIIKDDEYNYCKEYLSAWENMCGYVIQIKDEGQGNAIRQVMKGLAQLDMKVTKDQSQINSCILSPLHPYVLNSYLKAAEYARSNLGNQQIGEKIDWLLDKIVPMYNTIILGSNDKLFHTSKSIWPEFRSFSAIVSKPVNIPTGLVKIIRSYIGFHPYSKDNISILLIDLPEGKAVGTAVNTIANEVKNLSVYQYNTPENKFTLDNHLSPSDNYNLRTIPHNTNFDDWIKLSPQSFNIIFNFKYSKEPEINPGQMGRYRGIHTPLKITLEHQDIFTDNPEEIFVPKVHHQPNQADSIIRIMMNLTHLSEDTTKWEISPMMDRNEMEKLIGLSKKCDWIISGSPHILGSIPPKKLTENLIELGCESFGDYLLYAFSSNIFVVKRMLQEDLSSKSAPIQPQSDKMDKAIEILCSSTPNGILSMGRSTKNKTYPQMGSMAAIFAGKKHE